MIISIWLTNALTTMGYLQRTIAYALKALVAIFIVWLIAPYLPNVFQGPLIGASLPLHVQMASEDRMSMGLDRTDAFRAAYQRHEDQVARGGPRESVQVVRVDLSLYGTPYFWDDWRIHFKTECEDYGIGPFLFTEWSRPIEADLNQQTQTFFQGQCKTTGCQIAMHMLRGVGKLQDIGISHTPTIELGRGELHAPAPEEKGPHELAGVRCE